MTIQRTPRRAWAGTSDGEGAFICSVAYMSPEQTRGRVYGAWVFGFINQCRRLSIKRLRIEHSILFKIGGSTFDRFDTLKKRRAPAETRPDCSLFTVGERPAYGSPPMILRHSSSVKARSVSVRVLPFEPV